MIHQRDRDDCCGNQAINSSATGVSKMTSKLKFLVASTAMAAALGASAPSFAVGTAPNTDINNSVTVNFQVGGVAQTPATSNTDTFKVDRKVNFTVVERVTVGTTSVTPGLTAQQTAFTLTNLSNDLLDFNLTAANLTTGATTPRGTDAFDVSNITMCLDANADNACDAAATATLTVNDLSAVTGSNSINILVFGDIPLAATNGQISGVSLTATGLFSSGAAFVTSGVGKNVSLDTDPNTTGVETILADTGRNGVEAATDDYTVQAAALNVWKSSRVISDGVSATNPKALPNAVVEYCISVQNSGGAAATSVAIEDFIPANTTYVASSILLGATVTGHGTASQACTGGTAGGTYTAGPPAKVNGTLASVAGGGGVSALIFRVTIN
jgi:uncharacterized repeat protein (TIGR01451 family)